MVLLYLDPGSGSMIIQTVIAGMLGVAMFFKNIKLYILTLFRMGGKNNQTND